MRADPHPRDPSQLPDFRNLGVALRVMVLSKALQIGVFFSLDPHPGAVLVRMIDAGLYFEPSLLCAILLLVLASPRLRRLPYPLGAGAAVLLVGLCALGVQHVISSVLTASGGSGAGTESARVFVSAVLIACGNLLYFDWRQRVLSPALAEARLTALQARIRPHFLFNSINTAVSLIRQDPRLAERVLLDLADLFRALLAESRSLIALDDELRLSQAYLEIEQLRLGERLRVHWDLAWEPQSAADRGSARGLKRDSDSGQDWDCAWNENPQHRPGRLRVPMLLLQPLLENAVHHGIEPNPAGGEVHIRLGVEGDRLLIEIRNPLCPGAPAPVGNRMALENIRERLDLHFDAEASLRSQEKEGEFVVRVVLPAVFPAALATGTVT